MHFKLQYQNVRKVGETQHTHTHKRKEKKKKKTKERKKEEEEKTKTITKTAVKFHSSVLSLLYIWKLFQGLHKITDKLKASNSFVIVNVKA